MKKEEAPEYSEDVIDWFIEENIKQEPSTFLENQIQQIKNIFYYYPL